MVGQLAMLAAAASYAFAATFTRRNLHDQPPLIQAFMVVLFADALLWIIAPITEAPFQLPSLPITWLALLWLGLLGSCVAYLLFFFLINTWGPTRASVVTYTFPVVGLILGVIFLNEAIDGRLIFGTALIVGGIGVVNIPSRKSQAVASAAQD
jgi:drug/metabolite transporter (DMT)-like permease